MTENNRKAMRKIAVEMFKKGWYAHGQVTGIYLADIKYEHLRTEEHAVLAAIAVRQLKKVVPYLF